MIPPIRQRQIFGIVAVLAVFILVEFVVGGPSKGPTVLSNQVRSGTTH